MTEAYIALGSNVGDRELNLLRGVAEVGNLAGCQVTALSSFYETSPVGTDSTGTFFNAVLRITTELGPRQLLSALLDIEERVFRRERSIANGPRSLDLDLLLYGEQIITETDLIIPHPRMTERRFVLQPLSDIGAELLHPVARISIGHLLKSLNSDETVTKL